MSHAAKTALIVGSLLAICWGCVCSYHSQERRLPSIQEFRTFAAAGYFSPDDKWLVTINNDKQAQVWNRATGKLLNSLGVGHEKIAFVAFSSDGSRLALGSTDNDVGVWNTSTWHRLQTWHSVVPGGLRSLEFKAGARLLLTSSEKYIRYWNVMTGKMVQTRPNPLCNLRYQAVSPDKTLVVSTGGGGKVVVHNILSGAEVTLEIGTPSYPVSSIVFGKPYDHPNRVHALQFSRDGSLLAASCDEAIIKVWEMPSGQEIASMSGYSVCIAPDSKMIAFADDAGTVTLWDTTTRRTRSVFLADNPENFGGLLNFSSDGSYLAVSTSTAVKLWKVDRR